MRAAGRSYRIFVLTVYACLINSHLITITMIRKNALLCKLIRIKTSSKFIFDSYMDNYQPQTEICPICKSQGNCRIHAYYNRSVIDFRYGHKVKSSLCVKRLICGSCGHTHAILPDVLIPYASYSLIFILRVLGEFFLDMTSIEALCEKFSITSMQFYKWLQLWRQHKQLWLGILSDMEISNWFFLKSLVLTETFSDFGTAFCRQFSYSFLQAHKNPFTVSS